MQLATFPCLPYSSTKVLFVSFFVLCLFNWATALDEGKKEKEKHTHKIEGHKLYTHAHTRGISSLRLLA